VLFVDGAAVNARATMSRAASTPARACLPSPPRRSASPPLPCFVVTQQTRRRAPDVPDKPVLVSSSRSTGSQYNWAIHKSHSRIARGTTPRPSLCNLLITTGKISPLLLMPSPPAQANGSHAPIQQSSPEGGTAEPPRRRGSDGATAVPASTSTRPTAGTESHAAVPC
jgi:hypothetical protein